MTQSVDSTRDAIEAVYEHWIVHRGLDAELAAEMKDELADHLGAATADGTPLEQVTGPNIKAFADNWADVNVEPKTWGTRLGLLASATTAFMAAVIGARAIFERTLTVTLNPIEMGLAALLGTGFALLFLSPFGSRLTSSTKVRKPSVMSWAFGFAWAIVLTGWIYLAGRIWPDVTWTLPWWVAPIAVAVTVALVVLPLRPFFQAAREVKWVRRLVDFMIDGLP